MEPSRWELKIPLRVLCILSDDIERMGLPNLRAKQKFQCIQNSAALRQKIKLKIMLHYRIKRAIILVEAQ